MLHSDPWRFETLSDAQAVLGESPVWSARDNGVWWVDVTGRKLLRTAAADGRTQVWPTPEEIGFVVPTAEGRLVAGMESGLFLFDPARGGFTLIWRLEGQGVRFNDAATDSAGRLWAATCDIENREAAGELLCIEPDLAVRQVVAGLLTPNGLAADSAGGWLYLSDSHPTVRSLWRLPMDVANGATGERQEVADFGDLKGRPDGGAFDAAGTYWIAGVGGSALHGFAPDGRRLAEIAPPMESPTKFVFGGSALDRVFLTSKAGDAGGGRLAVATPSLGRAVLHGRGETPFGYVPG
ncbi:MAG: SMP-30/gluconolactonase/LRE family protein [Kiloniellaceae bacterium]